MNKINIEIEIRQFKHLPEEKGLPTAISYIKDFILHTEPFSADAAFIEKAISLWIEEELRERGINTENIYFRFSVS